MNRRKFFGIVPAVGVGAAYPTDEQDRVVDLTVGQLRDIVRDEIRAASDDLVFKTDVVSIADTEICGDGTIGPWAPR